jgi:hypothetical protein
MKKILIILFLFINLIGFSQQINEPVKQPNLVWYFENAPELYIFYRDPDPEVKVEPTTERNCVILTFISQIGVREKGINSGVEVEMYLAAAGLGKGNPWCASFVAWTFKQCTNIKVKSAGWVPSWFPKNKLIFRRGELNVRPAQSGDLIGIWFANKNRLAHIGFYQKESGDFTISVEGNTNEEGSREGDGVYRKRRITRTIHSISSWLPY